MILFIQFFILNKFDYFYFLLKSKKMEIKKHRNIGVSTLLLESDKMLFVRKIDEI